MILDEIKEKAGLLSEDEQKLTLEFMENLLHQEDIDL